MIQRRQEWQILSTLSKIVKFSVNSAEKEPLKWRALELLKCESDKKIDDIEGSFNYDDFIEAIIASKDTHEAGFDTETFKSLG